MTEDTTRTIELTYKQDYELTINPTPSNSLVTLKVNGEVVSSGTGVQSYTAVDETTIEYTVSMFEYYDKTGSFTLDGKDTTIDVSLDEMPWITGTFTNTDRTVATTKEDVVYHPGKYLIEMWGVHGGQFPCCRTVGDEGIGEQDDGREMFQCHLRCGRRRPPGSAAAG